MLPTDLPCKAKNKKEIAKRCMNTGKEILLVQTDDFSFNSSVILRVFNLKLKCGFVILVIFVSNIELETSCFVIY